MATRTRPPANLATLQAAADGTFWELVAKWGYARPAEIEPDQAWFWTRNRISGEIEGDINRAEARSRVHQSTDELFGALDTWAKDADVRRG